MWFTTQGSHPSNRKSKAEDVAHHAGLTRYLLGPEFDPFDLDLNLVNNPIRF